VNGSEKRRRTALHEAGHAVIARAAGFNVHEVSLREEGGGVCWVEARTRTSPEDIRLTVANPPKSAPQTRTVERSPFA